MSARDDDRLLNREQREALDHVFDVRFITGDHDVNHCPPGTDAHCPHRAALTTIHPEDRP